MRRALMTAFGNAKLDGEIESTCAICPTSKLAASPWGSCNDVSLSFPQVPLMPASLSGQLVVAISSRALFDFEEENQLFEGADDRAYMQHQLDHVEVPAQPGVAFSLVRKLPAFNQASASGGGGDLVAQRPSVWYAGVSLGQTLWLAHRARVFTRGRALALSAALQAHLFLSANEADVRSALVGGVPAARVLPTPLALATRTPTRSALLLTVMPCCFLARLIYQAGGLDAFQRHEVERAAKAAGGQAIQALLQALHDLQHDPADGASGMRIRTALVTARGARHTSAPFAP